MKTVKEQILKRDFKKEYNKYYRTMNYQIMSIEIDALYNVLVLKKRSKFELTRKWEAKVIEILLLF
jgi:hypothetical protein